MVLRIWMPLCTPELLLNAAGRLAVALLCRCLRECRLGGKEQRGADNGDSACVLEPGNHRKGTIERVRLTESPRADSLQTLCKYTAQPGPKVAHLLVFPELI